MDIRNIFRRNPEKRAMQLISEDFKVINGYNTSFTTYAGGLYEMGLTRAAISSTATQCSKLNPIIVGEKYKKLEKRLQMNPNPLMTTQQFLSKLITILEVENNAFIIPVYKDVTATVVTGFYPVRASESEIVKHEGNTYLKYKLGMEDKAIEYDRVGHLKNHYYKQHYYGESNNALNPTMELINTQNQGIEAGIKQGANIRFIGKLSNILLDKDLKAEKERLRDNNLSIDNNSGILLFDNKYAEIKPIKSEPFIVDDKQMKFIKDNVMDYFHICEEIIQNKADENQWNSFYEGKIEPIAIQLGQILTRMLFTTEEIDNGSEVVFESTRLQFASNKTKLEVSQTLFDRGVLSINQVNEIWNLPPVKDGDKRYIRKEYAETNNLGEETKDE